MVYNLLTNALKYSFRGSNIHFDWIEDPEDSHFTLFRVSDYGVPLDKSFDIYGMYKKGKSRQGSGLGLYISRKIAMLHDGTLFDNGANAQQVSQYNIPLLAVIDHYQRTDPSRLNCIDVQEMEKYNKEIQRLRLAWWYERVVAQKKGELLYCPTLKGLASINRLREEIQLPTYEVTFTARIPKFIEREGEYDEE